PSAAASANNWSACCKLASSSVPLHICATAARKRSGFKRASSCGSFSRRCWQIHYGVLENAFQFRLRIVPVAGDVVTQAGNPVHLIFENLAGDIDADCQRYTTRERCGNG